MKQFRYLNFHYGCLSWKSSSRPALPTPRWHWQLSGVNVESPIHGKGKRETNTMPQWAGSCWYYLRYLDPTNSEKMLDESIENAWLPVDFYIGGSETCGDSSFLFTLLASSTLRFGPRVDPRAISAACSPRHDTWREFAKDVEITRQRS